MVLPLRTVLFQFFFILISVAIEAVILHWRLQTGRQKSVEYAAAMNLSSIILGWLIFFFLVSRIPNNFQGQVISYIFFNVFFDGAAINPVGWMIVAAITTFFVGFFLKLKSLELFQFFIKANASPDEGTGNNPLGLPSFFLSFPGFTTNTLSAKNRQPRIHNRQQASAVLWAHAASNSAVLLILFLRNLFIKFYEIN